MRTRIFKGDINQCYGCQACEQACPKHCITMVPNYEGFLFPKIDFDACIDCGLCEKVCPASEGNPAKIQNCLSTEVFAGWNNDLNEVLKSTSAAIFPLLAEGILNKGGVVYGCAWDFEDEIYAKHIRISDLNELYKLRGSKYVQSSLESTFIQVKEDLKNEINVLYSGTPCQIAGLKLFLQKDYENLITIDLVCHGVPSSKMLSAYVNYIERRFNSKISSLNFRDKRKSGWRSYVSWKNVKTGKKTYRLGGSEPYLYGFYNEYFSRESCYNCKFSNSNRPGDITLSDYWGIEKAHPDLKAKHKYGINMIMCNSLKGSNLLKDVESNITLVNSKLIYAQNGNHRLVKCGKRPKKRDYVYKDLDDKGFEYMIRTYLRPPNYRIHKIIPPRIKNLIKLIAK